VFKEFGKLSTNCGSVCVTLSIEFFLVLIQDFLESKAWLGM